MSSTGKILVVDDEQEIRRLVKIILEAEGYEIIEAENGEKAILEISKNTDVDAIVMDIMMPELSGTKASARIRQFNNAPILFLTAKTKDDDKDEAYKSGGDDFLAKPFSRSDLVYKINSLVRRYRVYKGKNNHNNELLEINGITINERTHEVKCSDEVLHLTEKEYELLIFLALNRGKPWKIDKLYEEIWHEKYLPSSANTVMVHILRLRQKLELNPTNPAIIRSVYGKGYQID